MAKKSANGICKFCLEKFEPKKLGGHIVGCKKNPGRDSWREKIRKSLVGKKLSDSHRKCISETITEKVKNDEWHFSFSKSRSYRYKGVTLYGTWELKYAEYLDRNQIIWRRPKEKFPYIFEEKISYYTPDFFLENENVYVEIKGYKVKRDESKWAQFPKKLVILRGQDLIDMGILNAENVR